MKKSNSKNKAGSGERVVINKGRSWLRWFMLPVAFFSIPTSLDMPYFLIANIILITSIAMFFVLKRAKRLEHDEVNLYLIRDKKEKVIPFTDIVSIKRSNTKVNGERFWKIRYKDEGQERTVRYFRLFFNKEFHQAVRDQNPEVVIWTHPHFNH